MKKILLIDDHSDIRRLIRIALGKAYEVIEAESGQSGLALARSQRPELLILDVMMPGDLDGLAVLEALKADPATAGIKVVMVTARGQSEDYDVGIAKGADAYFVKPFSPLQLVACIRELLA